MSAAYFDDLPSNKPRLFGRKKQDGIGNVSGFYQLAKRNLR
jgi:hypothetical protein